MMRSNLSENWILVALLPKVKYVTLCYDVTLHYIMTSLLLRRWQSVTIILRIIPLIHKYKIHDYITALIAIAQLSCQMC